MSCFRLNFTRRCLDRFGRFHRVWKRELRGLGRVEVEQEQEQQGIWASSWSCGLFRSRLWQLQKICWESGCEKGREVQIDRSRPMNGLV
jgi:hypothetical protein